MDNFPGFCYRLFKVWRYCDVTVFWLLEELMIYRTQFSCETGLQVVQKMCEAGVTTLGQLVNVCGQPI